MKITKIDLAIGSSFVLVIAGMIGFWGKETWRMIYDTKVHVVSQPHQVLMDKMSLLVTNSISFFMGTAFMFIIGLVGLYYITKDSEK